MEGVLRTRFVDRALKPECGSPSPFLGGTVFLPVLVEFLVGNSGTAGKGLLGSFETKRFLQFLIADVCGVLRGDAPLGTRLGGGGKRELTPVRTLEWLLAGL